MKIVVGIDEVGRGPWAGPVVSAAVALPKTVKIIGVKDSKLLTHQKRIILAQAIKKRALGIGIGWTAPAEVDRYGLTWAVQTSMERALEQIYLEYEDVIIDGNFNFLKIKYPSARTVIKADQKYPCVSSASIIAKVARDQYMRQMAKLYPIYSFDTHVGYGTSHHRKQILKHGPSPIHRYSFKPLWQYRPEQLGLSVSLA